MKRIFTTLVSIVALQFAGFLAIAQWQALPSPTGLVINDITYHDSRFFLSTKTGVYTLHPDEDEVKYYDMGIEGVEKVNFFEVSRKSFLHPIHKGLVQTSSCPCV